MPAGGRALLALLGLPALLALGCAADSDFSEGGPERRRPGPGPSCPRDCGCTQEGVVDCGGIDLKEFPLLLPELTNHLSLQVRGDPAFSRALIPALSLSPSSLPGSIRCSRPGSWARPMHLVIGILSPQVQRGEKERHILSQLHEKNFLYKPTISCFSFGQLKFLEPSVLWCL